MEESQKTQQPQTADEDLTVEYANNVYFSPNIWDLKLIFGELGAFKPAVEWHTSITLPWRQVKLMAYYLAINLAAYELNNGPIKVPPSMFPPEPPPPEGPEKDNPLMQAVFEMVREHREKFLAGQK